MRRLGTCLTVVRRLRRPFTSPAIRMPLSVVEYDRLEHAITKGTRLALLRRGTEYLVIPERLRIDAGREVIVTRHPTTGHRLELFVDEIDRVEPVQ